MDGFIILCEKNKNNQNHFDLFVTKLFDKICENSKSIESACNYFKKLCEISPYSYANFIKKLISDGKDIFKQCIDESSSSFNGTNKFLTYVFSALEGVLKCPDFSQLGFEIILDTYYLFDDDIIFNEVIKCLSPLANLSGLIAIPYNEKIDYFFHYIANKDPNKTYKIVKKIYQNDNNSIMIGVSLTYRNAKNEKSIVTYSEIFETCRKAFKRIENRENNGDEILELLKNLLRNIHHLPFNEIKEELHSIKNKILKEDDELKAKAYREILETRESILKYKDWENLKKYLPVFDNILRFIKPSDAYIYYKYILIDDNYPLYNPLPLGITDRYGKTIELEKQFKKEALNKLVEEFGQSVIEKVIKDCASNSLLIWPLIYSISDDHLRDFDVILNNKIELGIRLFMESMNDIELNDVLNKYGENQLVIKNLPYREKVYKWINGKNNEQLYWENQFPDLSNKENYEYLFNKFLKFAPLKLISYCNQYFDSNYDLCIKVLAAISNEVENGLLSKFTQNDIYLLDYLVKKMDRNYYTEELSLCEFKLLNILTRQMEDLPMGIKKYFWDNPSHLGKLLIELRQKRNLLKRGSISEKILFEAEYSICTWCYIPSEFISLNRSKLKLWSDGVLSACNNDVENRILLKHAIINTLATCPKQISENVWPIKEVADILEDLAREDFKDKYDVSARFFCAFTNRIGLVEMNDGKEQFLLSEEFKKYRDYYRFNHPYTSKALEYISDNYIQQGEYAKTTSLLGHE